MTARIWEFSCLVYETKMSKITVEATADNVDNPGLNDRKLVN